MKHRSRLKRIEAKTTPKASTCVRILCVRGGESVSEARQRQKFEPPEKSIEEIILRGVTPISM